MSVCIAKILPGILGGLVILVSVGWLGLWVKPGRLPAYPEQSRVSSTIEVPADLPTPVARFYEMILGDQVPVIESAILTGRARLRFNHVTFPSRFRFTHAAGQDYRHYIEVTIFGLALMRVNEYYLDGNSRMELPFGVIENEPKIDMAANLGLWGESIWLPSIYLTDSRVRWEAIDETTARLVVPFDENEDIFTVTFDLHTGLIRTLEAMRYREPTDTEKHLWRLEPLGWQNFDGIMIPTPAAVTWLDEGTPWSVWTIEDVAYNVEISEYIRLSGR